jgi:hypothetical protein
MLINSERQRPAPLLERKSLLVLFVPASESPVLRGGCTTAPCSYVGCTTITEDEMLRFLVSGVK